jgi:NAD-dependent SIR2 family protein deacetylase
MLAMPETPGSTQVEVLERLRARFAAHRRWFVLTGAGISTASGIPDYRDAAGGWKRKPPVTGQAFVGDAPTRRRYWARSMIGWPRIAAARPNAAHRALARLQAADRLSALVTQNVDGLHQAAGAHAVIDLHGRLDAVVCLGCGQRVARRDFQAELQARNPDWAARITPEAVASAPDGDVDLESQEFASFEVPACRDCGGLLKPDVVFFGENVPRGRVEAALGALARADAMLVVGSSLMVYSGFRFAREAAAQGMPVCAVNLGVTRADAIFTEKFPVACEVALGELDASVRSPLPHAGQR